MIRFGIDLGTTNTCVYKASFGAGDSVEKFEISPQQIHYGNIGDLITPPRISLSMPSAIYARRTDDGSYEYFLGAVATRMARKDRNSQIINTKRLLCREDPDTVVAYGLTAQGIAQKLLEGCRYSLSRNGINEYQLKFAKYCITQPAAFGLFASRGIQDAAIDAGFPRAEAQREPIAALLSYLYKMLKESDSADRLFERQAKSGNKMLMLVIDIGGGTTDVTIQEVQVSGTRVPEQGALTCSGYKVSFLNQVKEDGEEDKPVATANLEPAFGGYDFDKAIVQKVIECWNEQYREKTGNDYDWKSLEGSLAVSGLYQSVQKYKNGISEDEHHAYARQEVILDNINLVCELTEEDVYKWTSHLVNSPIGEKGYSRTVYGIIADTISRSGYKIEDVDCCLVTGGMSGYFPIRKMIKEKFSELDVQGKLVFSDSPLDDIAIGAAVCDCFFKVDSPQSTLYGDLMIDDPCGVPRVLVKKNSPLPVESRFDNFMQLRNPAYLYVDVLWGRGPKECDLTRLRRLRRRLPNGRVTPIGTNISIEYKIDAHQAMDVKLIVHDPREEYEVPLLELIKDVDLSNGEDK